MNFEFKNASCYLISLMHREDRRNNFVKNTDSKGFELNTFEWINAVSDEEFGGLGCAKSHVLAMTKFITETDNKYCCIFEDDFHFRESKLLTEKIINKAMSDYQNFNVFMLGGTFVSPIPTESSSDGYSISKVFEANSASGYIVKRDYIKSLMNTFIESILGMEAYRSATPRKVIYDRFAIDQTWKRLQRQDNWYCTIPMLGEQAPSYSDIEKINVDYSNYSS
jgi:glycosyl transferase family 25